MKTSLILYLLLQVSVCLADLIVTAKDTAVMLGDPVTIQCNYESTDDPGSAVPKYTWYKIDAEENAYKLLEEGLSNPVAVENGMSMEDGALKIAQATWTIATNFSKLACDVELGRIGLIRSNSITLQVISLPDEDAEIDTRLSTEGDEGFALSVISTNVGSCTSPASRPAATIQFYKNGQNMKSSIAETPINSIFNEALVTPVDNGKKYVSEKEFYKTLDESDDGANFMCNVKVEFNGVVYYEQNQSMPAVHVKYPTDKAEWVNEPTAYRGETITLRCQANGFPVPTISINGEEGAEKEITITDELDGTEYECTAANSLNSDVVRSSAYLVNVLSAEEPVISGDTYTSGTAKVFQNEDAEFKCSATGIPQPSVAWYDSNDSKVSDTGTLLFAPALLVNTGKYYCKSSVDGHENLSRSSSLELDVRGLEINGKEEEVIEGKEGDKVLLDCAVKANPQPSFDWEFEDDISLNPLESKTEQHEYSSQVTVGPLTSEFSKKVFTCTVTNDDTTVTKRFVMPEIATASGSTTGIIIAILLIILIVAIVIAVLYNKGIICKKGEKGDESAEEDIAPVGGDVEAGNGKLAVEEANAAPANPEEEKLMTPDEEEK